MRNIRKKYKRPKRPYDSARIKEERSLARKYGLKRKREIWRAEAVIRGFRQRARKLTATKDKDKEKVLIDKLVKMGILPEKSTLDDVLALELEHILSRRLETVIFRKGLAKTPKEARQMIAHGRVTVDGTVTKYPSYLVRPDEEGKIKTKGAE